MRLTSLHVQNFRGIEDLNLDLGDTTVLVGENNTGKTSVLAALKLCLRDLGTRGRVVFDTYDFHLKDESAEPHSSNPISITLTSAEADDSRWPDPLTGKLTRQKILQVDPKTGLNNIRLRVTCAYEPAERTFKQAWGFLNTVGEELTGIRDSALGTVQHAVAYFYLAALRDAGHHFDARGPFWRPFLKDNQLPEDKRAEIETRLKELNDLVVASHDSFAKATTRLKSVQDVVPLASGDVVSIEAVPGRMFDMLAKAQVHLGTATGAKIPVGRHGEGTQSLAVLMLFSAFLEAWPGGSPIVALEEPESHLHPSAVRALWSTVEAVGGQKIVSTHSGDLLSEVAPSSLRRLVRTAAGIKSFRLGADTLTPDEDRKFSFHIRHARGELLFARCWLLVEGETEVTLLTEIARHLGLSLEQRGVRCVPHRNAGIELFLKVARDFGISWCVLADNDSQGRSDQEHVGNYATGTPTNDILQILPEADIENHLCMAGFGGIYEEYLSPQTEDRVTVPKEDPEYWPQVIKAIKKPLVKPAAALEAVKQMKYEDAPVPPLLEATIRMAIKVAGAV